MDMVHRIDDLRARLQHAGRVAFVPTMGHLHDGHLSLLRQAQTLGDVSVASIFVNRLQFLPHEDFDSYPRTWERDCQMLEAAGCDVLFAPRETDLYPVQQTYKVHPNPELADILEGEFRPGFFVGVSTVVLKLFMAVFGGRPGVAVFGQKDYQQLLVIRQMVAQFALPIEIVAGPTRRETDGLAMSSRNAYLSPQERTQAVALAQALQALGHTALQHPPGEWPRLEAQAMTQLKALGWWPDYLTVRQRHNLQRPDAANLPHALACVQPGAWVVLGAAKLGQTRLIDNLEI